MKEKKMPTSYFVGCLFAIIVLFLGLANLFAGTKKVSETENRELAQKPELSVKSVLSGDYAKEYQKYFNDQFVFRDSWIKIKTSFDRCLGNVEENGVYIGRDHYLFQKFEKPDSNTMKSVMKAVETLKKEYKDIPQFSMIVPSSGSVLKEKLPTLALQADENAYLDQIDQEMKEMGIQTIDVRNTFKSHKKEKLYYQTDHHWTTYGAYLAFQQFAETAGLDVNAVTYEKLTVTDRFQGTLSAKSGFETGLKEEVDVYVPKKNANTTQEQVASIVEYTDEQKKTGSFYNTAKLDQRNAYEVFFGGNHGLMKIKTPTAENRRLLVLKDSYANCFLPFLAPYYREIVVVDPRYYYGDLKGLMETEEINEILYLYSTATFVSDTSLATLVE